MKEIKDKIYGELLQANQQEGWKERELLEVGRGKNKWRESGNELKWKVKVERNRSI